MLIMPAFVRPPCTDAAILQLLSEHVSSEIEVAS